MYQTFIVNNNFVVISTNCNFVQAQRVEFFNERRSVMQESVSACAVECRTDCQYYSTYTNTCDYTLLMYHTRGCPRNACTKYVKRTAPRPWSRVSPDTEDELFFNAREDQMTYIPEPPLEPHDNDGYVTAGCGHELFEGEDLYEWDDGQTLCADCLEDRFCEMSLAEKAVLLGCEHLTVCFSNRGGS